MGEEENGGVVGWRVEGPMPGQARGVACAQKGRGVKLKDWNRRLSK